MRINNDYFIFSEHKDWYTHVKGVGYVPTEKAPKEAAAAMKRFNEFLKWRTEKGYCD